MKNNNRRPMRKSELFEKLADEEEMSKRQARRFLETLRDIVYDELKTTGKFVFPDLGIFTKKRRKARMGRNPATGAEIKIPAKTVLKFRVAKAVKDACLD
jgi:DNA-binding protein HU-beta